MSHYQPGIIGLLMRLKGVRIHVMLPFSTEQLEAIERLSAECGVARLDLFGSVSRGDSNAGSSDFDFLVEFRPVNEVNAFDRYFNLLEGLEAICGRRVDLIVRKAMRNPFFIRSVETSRRKIYVAQAA
jgi:uncharacterized protein